MSLDWHLIWKIALVVLIIRVLRAMVIGLIAAGREYKRTSASDYLAGVMLCGDRSILTKAQHAANEAGWEKSRFLDDENLMIFSPPDYAEDNLSILLKKFEGLDERAFGLKLINGQGKAVGPNGEELEPIS